MQTLTVRCTLLQVSKVSVDDYNKFVREADEMWLDKILAKIKSHK